MKALDPVKLLGITFNQSPTQDRTEGQSRREPMHSILKAWVCA